MIEYIPQDSLGDMFGCGSAFIIENPSKYLSICIIGLSFRRLPVPTQVFARFLTWMAVKLGRFRRKLFGRIRIPYQ